MWMTLNLLAGQKHNIDPMWKVHNKQVDLGKPFSFLDHEHLGFTQRHCETRNEIVDKHRNMFESQEQRENYQARKN